MAEVGGPRTEAGGLRRSQHFLELKQPKGPCSFGGCLGSHRSNECHPLMRKGAATFYASDLFEEQCEGDAKNAEEAEETKIIDERPEGGLPAKLGINQA